MNPCTPEQIARVCHDTIRAIQAITGDPPPAPPWESADPEMRESAIASVRAVLGGADAEEVHAVWCRGMAAAGWRRGEHKNPDAKTHPNLVPFDELPWSAQVKDRVFVSVVQAMSGESPAWFRSLLLERAQEAIAFQRERADAAEARAAENAITWGTSCTSCAAVLDSCARETARRERAEAVTARLLALFDEPDSWGMRRAVVTVRTLDRITGKAETAGAVTDGPEAVAAAPADSGTGDGTTKGGAAA